MLTDVDGQEIRRYEILEDEETGELYGRYVDDDE